MVKLIVENIELELFALYQSTDHRYKTKYRSILFNLKDPTNKELFRKVVLGEITPQYLVLMTPEKMARQDLTNWRNQKRQHTLDIIEREERTPHQIQITKLTHKGLIEVDTESNENWSLEDLSDSIWQAQVAQCTEAARKKDTTYEHKSHLLDPDCRICTGKMVPLDEASLSQWIPQEKTKSDITFDSSTIHTDVLDFLLHAEEGEKNTDGESPETVTAEESQSIWKGFIHMFSIKQFKVLTFLVSGYSSHLCQEESDLKGQST
ncbi:SPOC domain-containing protein 1 [Bombina bombina]|uniref:SPOC domain-containing protein 1 n=1 Tax=Bombina bombina TaxID=8345 RepID=UPI00235AE91C|nr:SPOC domain-containing protein 1 [Bombina bombina]